MVSSVSPNGNAQGANPASFTTSYGYDADGNRTSITDALGHTTTTTYDQLGRAITRTDPAGNAAQYSYEANGNLASLTDPLGNRTTFGYDANNERTSKTVYTGISAAAAHAQAVMADSPLLYWKLDETSGTTAADSSTSNQPGSFINSPTLGVSGAFTGSNATTLNGSSQYVQRLSPTIPTGSGARSIEVWFKTTSTAQQALFSYGSLGSGQQFTLFLTGSNSLMAWGWGFGNDQNFSSQSSMTDGHWHQIVETYDGSTMIVYLDGASLGSKSVSLNTVISSHGFNVGVSDPGGWDSNSNKYCTCSIDEVAVYGTALSAARVQAHYSSQSASSLTTTYGYNAVGNRTSVTDPLGHATTYAYNDGGELTTVTDPLGNAQGADPTQHQISLSYDRDGNLLSVTDQDGHTTSYAYDHADRRISSADAVGRTTSWTLDPIGQRTQTAAPDNSVTNYAYDSVGNLISRTDANNHTTSYAYDTEHELTRLTDPLSRVWTYGYDADGNRTSSVDAMANAAANPALGTTTYTYDALDRPTAITYSDGTHGITYSYDTAGNLATMGDAAGSLTYSYDADGNLTAATRGTSSFAYSYDSLGNLSSLTYPDGTNTTYGYDNASEITSQTTAGSTTSYGYDADGRLTTTTLPAANGYTATRTYDNAGWLTQLVNAKNGTALSSFAYTRNAAGEPTELTKTTGIQSYGYDSVGRLTRVCYQASTCDPGSASISWTYDPIGNRLSETRSTGTTTYNYDAADQLTQTSGPSGTTSYSYDADGRRTAAGTSSYVWNLANELTQATVGGTAAAYSYDGNGDRLSAASGGQTTNYLWNEQPGLQQLATETAANGNLLRRYLYNPDGSPLSLTTSAGGFNYLQDGLGSTANLTSGSGTTEWTYNYEPFGVIRSVTQNDPNAPANPLQFTGQYSDPTTGHYNLRARQYDPTTGAFLSPDPAPFGSAVPYASAYGYANGNPTLYTDPSGARGQAYGSSLYDPSLASNPAPSVASAGNDWVGPLVQSIMAACRKDLTACWAANAHVAQVVWAHIRAELAQVASAAVSYAENNPVQVVAAALLLPIPGADEALLSGEAVAAEEVPLAEGSVFVNGSDTANNLTPRLADANGLSSFDTLERATPPGGKAQCLNVACLAKGGLGAFRDEPPAGHFSIRPLDPNGLADWLSSRAAGTESESSIYPVPSIKCRDSAEAQVTTAAEREPLEQALRGVLIKFASGVTAALERLGSHVEFHRSEVYTVAGTLTFFELLNRETELVVVTIHLSVEGGFEWEVDAMDRDSIVFAELDGLTPDDAERMTKDPAVAAATVDAFLAQTKGKILDELKARP